MQLLVEIKEEEKVGDTKNVKDTSKTGADWEKCFLYAIQAKNIVGVNRYYPVLVEMPPYLSFQNQEYGSQAFFLF